MTCLEEIEERYQQTRHRFPHDIPWLVKLVERQGEALRSLYDEQNGPPLLNREAQWQRSMDEVLAVLNELEGK